MVYQAQPLPMTTPPSRSKYDRHQQYDVGTPRAPRPDPGIAPLPVLSMELVPALEAYFPAGSPVVHLLKAPAAFPESETTHFAHKGRLDDDKEILSVRLCSCCVV